MKNIEEIKAKLEATENSELLKQKPATIDINAPLALMQLSQESWIDALKWVLAD